MSVPEACPQFTFLRHEHFERHGMATDTAVYAYEGKEFVFVPGDTVTLGWDSFTAGMDEKTRADLQEYLDQYGVGDVDAFLRKSMSPVRIAKISPMLVERELNPVSWRQVPLDSEALKPFRENIENEFGPETTQLEIHQAIRLTRTDDGTIAELFEPSSHASFVNRIKQEGFALPTEDEWEYLCGGGSRTLFRWGDSFDYAMKLEHFDEGEPRTLQQPNQFGISIAYDPYRWEVIDSSLLVKGGDGGVNICGGSGRVMGYLPVATYYRPFGYPGFDDLDLENEIGGGDSYYRRVVVLR